VRGILVAIQDCCLARDDAKFDFVTDEIERKLDQAVEKSDDQVAPPFGGSSENTNDDESNRR
jgi:hypothetical protein